MPASQLKRLKASLREQGVTGQQSSKKSKKSKSNARNAEQRIRREAALASIRESFNPFEVKAPSRPSKFQVTSNKTIGGKSINGAYGRPGISKSYGEEQRRKTLLPELHRRNKVGGILDRRIGENDPTMTPDERMLQRFTKEKQKRKNNIYHLEDDAMEDELTHMGQSLGLSAGNAQVDDFQEDVSEASSGESSDGDLARKRKAVAVDIDEDGVDARNDEPARKRTKAEVMKEVIAKSKLHKYERQQAKEDDEELREELDKGVDDLMAALQKRPPQKPVSNSARADIDSAVINPERAMLIKGADRAAVEKAYDMKLREMAQDKRSKPTERSKTAEEMAAAEAERLRELTEKRLRRMRGESISDSEGAGELAPPELTEDVGEMIDRDDAAEFGLGAQHQPLRPLDVEDEDEFLIEDDLVASGSEADDAELLLSEDDANLSESASARVPSEDDDEEFVSGLLSKEEKIALATKVMGNMVDEQRQRPLNYSCPRSHGELLAIIQDVNMSDVVLVIQRIRALYNPQLQAGNKEKLADFSSALIDHLAYMGDCKPAWPLPIVETIIRHVHSLSRTFPQEIAKAFRAHLQTMHQNQNITSGQLIILTAIGTIYPTSDHFHQVVTPAMTIIARWLGLTVPTRLKDIVVGAYLGSLCIKYQNLSKRYIPELVRFTLVALRSPECSVDVQISHVANLSAMIDLWSGKSAFIEMFSPSTLNTLKSLSSSTNQRLAKQATQALQHLKILTAQSRSSRRNLALHNWRPLPIKTAIPKFEENFNPDRHYDPDRERHEASKLKAEYRKERKGAMRELRKDANFMARERLKEKKERDKAYEARQRKLIAEINAEEGAEANAYERERRRRKFGR